MTTEAVMSDQCGICKGSGEVLQWWEHGYLIGEDPWIKESKATPVFDQMRYNTYTVRTRCQWCNGSGERQAPLPSTAVEGSGESSGSRKGSRWA